ncbi:MAG: response regulator [Verrucomicrobiota bacterium]
MKILVVDDDELNRKVLRVMLEGEGYVVAAESDGLKGLHRLEEEPFDAVLSDILMPNFDGYRFCHAIRSREQWRNLPFIFLTSTYTSPSDEKFALELGADRFLRKPVSRKVLLETVRTVLENAGKTPHQPLPLRTEEVLSEYSHRLVAKLEEKNLALAERSRELEASEERFRLLVSSIKDYAIIMLDPDGGVVSWNSGAERINGYAADEIIGQHFRVFFAPEERQRSRPEELLKTTLAHGRAQFEGWRLRKGGARFWADVILTTIRDEAGALRGIVEILRDVTERKIVYEKLQQSRAELREMAARLESVREEEALRIAREIHDELGQALTSLNFDLAWFDRQMRKWSPPDEIKQPWLARLKSATSLLESTVRTVQRISGELRPAMIEELGLLETLKWKAEDFSARTGVPCDWVAIPERLNLSPAQSTGLFRIFQEILTNISRHARAAQVKVSLVHSDCELLLRVEDDGIGFDPAALHKHHTIGLTGMRERALLIGGEIEFNSQPGKGTGVTLRMPLAPAGSPMPDTASS